MNYNSFTLVVQFKSIFSNILYEEKRNNWKMFYKRKNATIIEETYFVFNRKVYSLTAQFTN